jgi:probable F420-dependent oxidoreductase
VPDKPLRPLQLSITAEGAMYPMDQQHRLLEVARLAEQLGVDYLDTTQHMLMGDGALTTGHGWEPHHLEQAQPEPLVQMAAFAGATSRIKLMTGIIIAPLYPAGLLAKAVASLHAISNGRFVLGVSTSWHKDEYDTLRVPFEERGAVLNEVIGACRALWETSPASFHGKYENFDGMHCSPRPAPGERIQVWFGGKITPRSIRRIVELGDGWMPFGGLRMSLEQKKDAVQMLRERYRQAGRDPASLNVCDEIAAIDGDIERSLAQVPAMAEAGSNVIRCNIRRYIKGPDDVLPVLERVVRVWEPYRHLSS